MRELTNAIIGRIAVIVKLIGSAVMLLCGALYAKNAQRAELLELTQAERLLEIFKYIKSEIEEFDTPLYALLKNCGIDGGVDALLAQIAYENLKKAVSEAQKLGRGYKKEDIRTCERLVSALESEKNRLKERVRETRAISRVKGIGISAAAVILLL